MSACGCGRGLRLGFRRNGGTISSYRLLLENAAGYILLEDGSFIFQED